MKPFYPKASEKRLSQSDPILKRTRKAFFKAAGRNFALLQLLFLGLFSYVFGSLFQQNTHTHNISIVFVDYDGGAIGSAIKEAYTSLQGDTFPTLKERPVSEFATTAELEDAVCRTDYWAALFVTPGASGKLQAALAGGANATGYQRNNVLAYIWNEARYSTVVDSAISANLQTLSQTARVGYATGNGTGQVQQLSSPEAISVFANPWVLSNINIQPTTQGSRAIYNTLVIILVMIQEFFYLGTINGLYMALKIYSKVDAYRIIVVRNLNSLVYCFIGSLCTTGAIWAFRSNWNVNASQFALNWMVLWIFAHLNFLTMDVFTIWLPPAYVPMALISWIIFNVTSILLPFELSPGFYRIGYAAPAHEVYQVLTDIWSLGCNPQLYYALPIIFSWEAFGFVAAGFGVFRRCHYAAVQEEEQARQFKERVDAAVSFERRRDREIEQKRKAEEGARAAASSSEGNREKRRAEDEESDEEEEREELEQAISGEDSQIRREKSRFRRECNFGPAFDLPFRGGDSDCDRGNNP